MSKQVRFYAAKDDLTDSIMNVENVLALKYADAWIHKTVDEIPIYDSLTAWKALGINKTGRTTGGGFFIVVPKDLDLTPKKIDVNDGSSRYKYEPILNPFSLVIQPSGVFEQDIEKSLIVGMFGTSNYDEKSQELFKSFRKLFLKGYSRFDDGSYIGPKTSRLCSKGELKI